MTDDEIDEEATAIRAAVRHAVMNYKAPRERRKKKNDQELSDEQEPKPDGDAS
jgi:hypothetical protein